MPPPKSKKELLNYLSKFSAMTVEVSKPLWKLTSVKAKWSCNKMYKDLYDKAKEIIRKIFLCVCDSSRPLCLENDESGDNLRAGLLQIREGMSCWHDEVTYHVTLCLNAFVSNSLSWRVLVQQHQMGSPWHNTWSWKFHHYWFTKSYVW